MSDTFTSFFLTVLLVEAALIIREMHKASLEKKWKAKANLLSAENSELKTSLEQAQKDLEGINFLWKKSLLAEQTLRKDLDIAKVQLTYLASKVVKTNQPERDVSTEGNMEISEAKTFWTKDEPVSSSSYSASLPGLEYSIKSTDIV